ncbi:MAG: hypothetical protein A2V65_05320 [Deltaproteobacteria bacterium RBG_13_49_15]|nr:MAG: hypothetical protein A2V65_05320 [Deltaproteobacteria bacterium RBG_13_49_15]
MATEGDMVLIYFEDKPISFARIEKIEPDVKAGWRRIKLFILQLPMQSVTWILRNAYINGEAFTMGGKRMRLEKVSCPEETEFSGTTHEEEVKPKKRESAKVIDFSDLLKKR